VADTQAAYANMLYSRRAPGDRELASEMVGAAGTIYRRLGIELAARRLADSPAAAWVQRAEPAAALPAAADASSAQATFRRDGHFWTVEFQGRAVRLKDSRGLFYLSVLLQRPDTSVSCLELVAAAQGGIDAASVSGSPTRSAQDLNGMGSEGSGGPLLDPQARQAYRERLGELRLEVDEAEASNDPGRADRARAEMDAITRELSAAVGLGGRSRSLPSSVERGRVAVTKAIVLAYKILAEEHPTLRAYLGRTIRTGQVCTFVPDPQQLVTWSL
jgi:hypothetical protein